MPTTTPFNNLITFSRGSNATVTGSNGLIQWAPNNLLTFSEQFDNAAWTKSATGTGVAPTVTPNVAVAPDGTTTADLVVFNRGAGNAIGDRSWLFQTTVVANASPYATSIYIKAATALDIGKQIAFRGVAGVAYQIVTLTDSWVRINSVETSISTSGSIELASRGTVSADNQVSAHVWGAQLELGSAATTYNSTTVKNLLGFSEAFDNAAWTKIGSSIVTGAQANPVNGAFNAQKLMEDTALSGHQALQTVVTTANPWTFSVFVKAGGRNWTALGITDSSSTVRITYFDLVNGVVGTVATGITASIVAAGNGWYRCAVRVASAVAGNNNLRVYATLADGTTAYTGDGNSGAYIYGAQLSDSASLDPYVPTPAAAPSSTAYYGPRFDYDPVTLAPKGLLVEEARTNLLTYSEQFDNASWTKTRSSVVANATTSPDGTVNADKLVEDATAANNHFTSQAFISTAIAYTFTVYAKAAERGYVTLFNSTVASGTCFDLITGVVGVASGTPPTASTITAVGNGWYRCSITVTATAASNIWRINVMASNSASTAYDGDGTSGIYLWGAQLEAGAFATSYIPTVASTVTRSADVATINGSLFSQWYNNTEGTLLANFVPTNSIASNTRGATITDGTNRVTDIYIDVSVWRSFNGTTNVTPAGSTAVLNSTVNFASAYKSGDYAASMNGGAVGTAATAGVQSANKLTIGTNITNSAGFLNGHIRQIAYYNTRLPNATLQSLTA